MRCPKARGPTQLARTQRTLIRRGRTRMSGRERSQEAQRMVGPDFDRPATYEITVSGRLPQNWADFLGGFQVAWQTNGEMVFRGLVVDQSALQGLLNRVYHWGLTLLAVRRLIDEAPEE